MQQITIPKLLILAAATYIVWSGLCCQWFRSFRHSLERQFHSSSMPVEQQQQQSHHHLRSHFGRHNQFNDQEDTSLSNNYASGIWLSKSIELVDDISENPSIEFSFDKEHCPDENKECHYHWGDVVSLNYSLQSTSADSIDAFDNEHAYVEGSFLVNDQFSWNFKCQLCGQECEQVDQFPQDLGISFDMPECDDHDDKSNPRRRHGSVSFALSSSLLTKSLGPLVLKGSLQVYSNGSSHSNNELLAQIGMNAIFA